MSDQRLGGDRSAIANGWAQSVLGPLVTATLIATVYGIAPWLRDHLGPLGDVLTSRWTPFWIALALSVIALAVRRATASPQEPPGYESVETDDKVTVDSDGLLWVFRGWIRLHNGSVTPWMLPECREHRIALVYRPLKSSKKLESLDKAGSFTNTRQLYCVGPEGAGHALRPSESDNMRSAQIRAAGRLMALRGKGDINLSASGTPSSASR